MDNHPVFHTALALLASLFPFTERLGLLLSLTLSAALTVSAATANQERTVAPDKNTTTALTPAPPFGTVRDESGWWLVAPDGRKFFSVGVCCLHQGTSREASDPENPSYAAWQNHSSSVAWADTNLLRLKAWGFTTAGGWADFDTLRQSREQSLWFTPVLHIGAAAGAPWWDMWDERNVRRMESVARERILPIREDPRLLGYYSDNELGWWNATLWKTTLEHPPSSGQRERLIELLRQTYTNDWKRLEDDFRPEAAGNWRELEQGGMLFPKPGSQGIHTMRRFLGLVADRYYQLMRDIIRQHDSRGLFLGDRYASFYYPEVARAAGRYVDVSSSNMNQVWNDGTFPRCYLDTLHALTGKPVLVSEFYLAANQNRSGNRNTHGIYPVVDTQAERAGALQSTIQALARLPYLVGADWFQFADEPKYGRPDGENFNFGLVDINERPYQAVTAVFAALNVEQLRAETSHSRPDASIGIPPAPADPFANFVPNRALKHWDREQGFVKPVSEFPLADLYLCWSSEALYLGLCAFELIEAASGTSLPKTDRPLWTAGIAGGETVRARIGAGREAIVSDPRVRVESLAGGNDPRNLAVMELPAALLGRNRFHAGDTVELECSLLTYCAAYQIEWKGKFTLGQ